VQTTYEFPQILIPLHHSTNMVRENPRLLALSRTMMNSSMYSKEEADGFF
jgi:hypothetical protein